MILRNLSWQEYKWVKHWYPISIFIPENDDGLWNPVYPSRKYTNIVNSLNAIIADYKENWFVEEEGVYEPVDWVVDRFKAYDAFDPIGIDVTDLTDEEIIQLHAEYQILVDICQEEEEGWVGWG